ncbi:GNAT family N-acetyltransferase [Paenibacillus hodogayensis]|uniref:GNAT family N-acetyltransferase n=1 Tax=Paenibacillus hodogayensis TaxID=279208 RepID=A0ABV5VQ05_9BACL
MDCGQSCSYEGMHIRRLGREGLAEVHDLMADVVSRIPDKALFYADDDQYFHELLEQDGEMYGAYDKEKLAAYSILAHPGRGANNLARQFGVPDEELSRVWVLDSTIVHESVRGRGLQRYFNVLREKRAVALGAKYLYSTVHPDNAASRRNLEAAGFVLQFTGPLYGALPRHCYAKRL